MSRLRQATTKGHKMLRNFAAFSGLLALLAASVIGECSHCPEPATV